MASELFKKGMKIRTEVLGEAYVKKAMAGMDEFNRPLQELVTEYCWGAVWGREGLKRSERSMINLAMISGFNRPHELKAHIRGAITNGVSREQISEVLLQVAIYVGVSGGRGQFPYCPRSVCGNRRRLSRQVAMAGSSA